MAEQVKKEVGKVDILVNNAGIVSGMLGLQRSNSGTKLGQKFSSLIFTVTSTNRFFSAPPPPLRKTVLKLVCNVKIVYGHLKSANSQDYARKPQRNCTFTNLASGAAEHTLCVSAQLYR